MHCDTAYLFFGDQAQVAEDNLGLRPRRPQRPEFRCAEHSTLGQDERMGMTVILRHHQTCGLSCIACFDASFTSSLL